MVARRRFLERYEWPSLWETREIQDELQTMWLLDGEHTAEEQPADDYSRSDPNCCPDHEKPRASVEQYVALVGADVAANLEGIWAVLSWGVEHCGTRKA